MKRTLAATLVLVLAACAPTNSARTDGTQHGLQRFLAALADTHTLDEALVERTLDLELAPDANGEAVGTRNVEQGSVQASVSGAAADITLTGKLPETPCVVSMGEFLEDAEALGYETTFSEVVGGKSAWRLSHSDADGEAVRLRVITNPPAQSADERQACVGYISVGTEAADE